MDEQIFIVTNEQWDDYVFIGNQGQCEGEVYSLLHSEKELEIDKVHIWQAQEVKFELTAKIYPKIGE